MELDHFVFKVQGVLKNEERMFGSLNTLKKGKEEDISKVVESLNKVVNDKELDSAIRQKLFILLFINTDTDFYNDLKKERKYTHLVGFLPKLSQDLFIRIVIDLKLHDCLYESVKYFCSAMSYQVVEICLNALSWIDLFDALSFVENLLTSLFTKIVAVDNKDKYSSHLREIFQRMLLYYDAEKSGCVKRMGLWKRSKLKHYGGLAIASLLSLLERCTKIYCGKGDCITKDDCSIYSFQIDQESLKLKPILGTENMLFSVEGCYKQVIDKCLENVLCVTVDLWLFWVEIDLDDIPDTENTLQRLVGDKAYSCQETLKEAECSGISSKETSELIVMLKNISLEPRIEEDQASLLNLDKILINIQDPNKDTMQWIRFLLKNSTLASDPDALAVIKNYFGNLDTDDLIKLFKLLFNFIKTNENATYHKSFVFELMKSLDNAYILDVAKCFVDTCGLSEILKTDDFQPLIVETFNKIINEEDKEKELYPQFLSLAVQSADATVSRAVAEGITSEVRGHLMADILSRLQPFCDAPTSLGKPLLVAALDNLLFKLPSLPEKHRANYPLFVRELVMRKNLNGESFIENCLMVHVHTQLIAKNWPILTACLETISELYDIDCVHNCTVSLFMLVQVVQATRWSPSTFNMTAVQVCELAQQLIDQFVTKGFDIGFQDKHVRNLSTLVRQRVSPLNRYHLSRLLTDEPVPADPALQLVYRMHVGIGEWSVLQVSPGDRLKLVHSLCYVLPVLTLREWQELFCVVAPKCSEFLTLFHIVTDSILVCLDSAKVNNYSAVMACLSFCVINVAQVLKYEVNRWTKDDNEYRISVLSKMCQVVAAFPPSHQEEFGVTLIKVLQQLLPEGSRRKPLTDVEVNSVTVSIASLKVPNVRQLLSKEFLDMVDR